MSSALSRPTTSGFSQAASAPFGISALSSANAFHERQWQDRGECHERPRVRGHGQQLLATNRCHRLMMHGFRAFPARKRQFCSVRRNFTLRMFSTGVNAGDMRKWRHKHHRRLVKGLASASVKSGCQMSTIRTRRVSVPSCQAWSHPSSLAANEDVSKLLQPHARRNGPRRRPRRPAHDLYAAQFLPARLTGLRCPNLHLANSSIESCWRDLVTMTTYCANTRFHRQGCSDATAWQPQEDFCMHGAFKSELRLRSENCVAYLQRQSKGFRDTSMI